MTLRKVPLLTAIAGLLVVAGLALVAHRGRRAPEASCALDGTKIHSIYKVNIVDGSGAVHQFCCPVCARIWLRQQAAPPQQLLVTDEASGAPVDAASAHYVRSAVVTVPGTGNRVHAFRTADDAEKYAERFAGVVLSEDENPLYQP
jgi:hypothetical protein